LTPVQHFIEVCQAILECFVINGKIIHEHLRDLLDQVREYRHHALLNDARAFHSTNDILLYMNVPYGHVKVVLLASNRSGSNDNQSNHPGSRRSG
jgi:hypothetical protein